MSNDKKDVVIDTDFFRKLTNNLTSEELFLKIMEEINKTPVMHEFVFKEELHEHSLVKKLKDGGFLKVYSFHDYLNDANLDDFKEKFNAAYKKLNYQTFPETDILAYRKCEESLGEIHSSLMAWYMNMDIMMSDDVDAKHYVTTMLTSRNKKIEVLNIFDILLHIGKMSNRNLKWKDVKGMAGRVLTKESKKYEHIKEFWVIVDT